MMDVKVVESVWLLLEGRFSENLFLPNFVLLVINFNFQTSISSVQEKEVLYKTATTGMPKTKKSHRANRNNHIEVSKAINTGSSAKLKKKIRDIERLLSKNDKLPADKKIEYERALKGLKVELQNSQNVLKAKNNATKYHMVRF